MGKPVILVADDIETDRVKLKSILEQNGYEVVTASNPESAITSLEQGRIELAILDYKLTDGSPGDKTGLFVARTMKASIPKLMVSRMADKEEILKTVGANKDGMPLLNGFLSKESYKDDDSPILEAVKAALSTGKHWRRQSRESPKALLDSQDQYIKWIDRLHSLLHLFGTAVFLYLMYTVVHEIHENKDGNIVAVFILIALIAAEVVNVLLAKKGHSSSVRADNYHLELLQGYRYGLLMDSCDEIEKDELRDQTRNQLVQMTASSWFSENATETKFKQLE